MQTADKINFINESFRVLFKKDAPEFTMNTPIGDMGIDSLDIVELQMEFEKKFNVEIPDPDTEIKTMGDLLALLDVRE